MNNYLTETAVYERVEMLIREKGMSRTKFADAIGVGQTTLNQQLNKQSLSLTTLLAILRAYPELSAEWLMRGAESMTASLEAASKMEEDLKKSEQELKKLREEVMKSAKHLNFLVGVAQDYRERYDAIKSELDYERSNKGK